MRLPHPIRMGFWPSPWVLVIAAALAVPLHFILTAKGL